jgi:DNA-binding MarR family transcriptional regulator
MTVKYFEKINSAFLGHFARRMADLIIEQGSEILRDLDLTTPATSISTMLYLDKNHQVTVAVLADALGVSHQMATQRINFLEKLSLVKRVSSPEDKRSKMITLTQIGQSEVIKLIPFTKKIENVFEELEVEMDCKLTKIIHQTELALRNKSLKERL